jgi:radical SAM protein with 4Fe4S-binding SPASM domain
LLWTELPVAIQKCKSDDISAVVYTSGACENAKQQIRDLHSSGVDRIIFSIYSTNDKIHDAITCRPGSLSKSCSALEAAIDLGVDTEIHCVPMMPNYRELQNVVSYAKRTGVKKVSVLRLVPQGRSKTHSYLHLKNEQISELRSILVRLKNDFDVRTGSPFNVLWLNPEPKCMAAIDRLTISPNLDVHPCDAFKQIGALKLVGTNDRSNLSATSLADCWENSPYLNIIRGIRHQPIEEPCLSCQQWARCTGGCVAQKIIESGLIHRGADPICLLQNNLERRP